MKKIKFLTILPVILCLLNACNSDTGKKANFIGNHVYCSNIPNITLNKDYVLNLNMEYYSNPETDWEIKPSAQGEDWSDGKLCDPNIEYELKVDDIYVYIDGIIKPESFVYEGGFDGKGILTVQKEFVTSSDIKIVCNGTQRTSHIPLVGCQIGKLIGRTTQGGATNPTLEIAFKSKYQNLYNFIFTLDEYGFTVWEDDEVDITFKVINNGEPLPKDLWFRTNARWGLEGVEFTREYNVDYTECHFHVPYFYAKDHIVFRSMSE